MNIRNILIGSATIHTSLANLGVAIPRVFAGLSLALAHGINKLPPSAGFVEGVAKLGFPLPSLFAWAAAFSEFFCGIFMAIGLLTRPAALLVAITMAVAAFGRHAADPYGRKEMALLYCCIALMYLLIGAGRYSLDTLLRKERQK